MEDGVSLLILKMGKIKNNFMPKYSITDKTDTLLKRHKLQNSHEKRSKI